MKRSPQKAFDAAANKVANISKTLADSVNLSPSATAMLRETIARKSADAQAKADGRLVNTTPAAETLKTTPIGKDKEVNIALNKQVYDGEETYTSYLKKEATENAGRVKSDTVAAKSVDIPAIRMPLYNDTSQRLPFEFRGVNQSEIVPQVGFNLGATVDVVNPAGEAHGPITFVGDVKPAVVGQTKNYVGPMGKHNFPMSQPQQVPQKPKGDTGSNIRVWTRLLLKRLKEKGQRIR